MNISKTSLFIETRGRVYLLWLLLVTGGFVATHLLQAAFINVIWMIISFVGLGYMFVVMPMRVKQMQYILWSWAVPIAFGMLFSMAVFQLDALASYAGYLGTFWLIVMAVGYAWNGLVDRPMFWYMFAAVINILAAIGTYFYQPFIQYQYLIAAIVSFWSMANLWIYRS